MSEKIFLTCILIIVFLSILSKSEIITDEATQEYGGVILITAFIVAFISGIWSIWA